MNPFQNHFKQIASERLRQKEIAMFLYGDPVQIEDGLTLHEKVTEAGS